MLIENYEIVLLGTKAKHFEFCSRQEEEGISFLERILPTPHVTQDFPKIDGGTYESNRNDLLACGIVICFQKSLFASRRIPFCLSQDRPLSFQFPLSKPQVWTIVFDFRS